MPDGGIDWRTTALERRMDRVEPLTTDVAVLRVEMRGLSDAVKANTEATNSVADQLEHVQLEPIERVRNRRDQLWVALVSAVAGGALAIIATLVGGTH